MSGIQDRTIEVTTKEVLPDNLDLEGDALTALDYCYKKLSMAGKNRDLETQAFYYNCIGNIFLKYQDAKSALKYYEKAQKLLINTGNQEQESNQFLYHLRRALVFANEEKEKDFFDEYQKASKLITEQKKEKYFILVKYLEMVMAHLTKDSEQIHTISLELWKGSRTNISMGYWDALVDILQIVMDYSDREDIINLFEMAEDLVKDNPKYKEKQLYILRIWIEYLEKTNQTEAKRNYLRTYYEIEHQTKENRKRNQIQQINNRLLLDQKLEERSQMKQRRKSLNENAKKDSLTDLYSRYAMMEYLEEIMERGARENKQIKGVSIEIDDFKTINDEHGYVLGDMCLKYLAEAIQRNNHEQMMAAHMRGNEMMVFTYDPQENCIERFMENLERSLRKPLFFNEKKIQIKINYGVIEILPTMEMTVFEVFQRANDALFVNKKSK